LAQVSKIAPLNTWFPELGFDLHALFPIMPRTYSGIFLTIMSVLVELTRAGENNVGEIKAIFVTPGVV
jgi:hypothetical protein